MEKKEKEMTNTDISVDDILDNYFGEELSQEDAEYLNKIVAEEADNRILEDEDFEEDFDYNEEDLEDDWYNDPEDDADDCYYESDDDWRNYSIEDSYADAFDGFEDAYWNID